MGFGDPSFDNGYDMTLTASLGILNHFGVVLLARGNQICYYPARAMPPAIVDVIRCRREAFLGMLHGNGSSARRDATLDEMCRVIEGPPQMWSYGWEFWPVTIQAHRKLAVQALAEARAIQTPEWQAKKGSRGIVLVGGGEKYFPLLWVSIKLIRHHGCKLPIEVWYLGRKELGPKMEWLLAKLGRVNCVNAETHPPSRFRTGWTGWQVKAQAILHSSFDSVIYLDCDNHPLINLSEVFEWPEYKDVGAIAWPEPEAQPRWTEKSHVWEAMGVPYRPLNLWETGQLVLDKTRCATALRLIGWYEEHADYYYRLMWGDTGTFQFGFLCANQPYMVCGDYADKSIPLCMCHEDFKGRRILQHRSGDKWRLSGDNGTLPGYREEGLCRGYLEELRKQWTGRIQ